MVQMNWFHCQQNSGYEASHDAHHAVGRRFGSREKWRSLHEDAHRADVPEEQSSMSRAQGEHSLFMQVHEKQAPALGAQQQQPQSLATHEPLPEKK